LLTDKFLPRDWGFLSFFTPTPRPQVSYPLLKNKSTSAYHHGSIRRSQHWGFWFFLPRRQDLHVFRCWRPIGQNQRDESIPSWTHSCHSFFGFLEFSDFFQKKGLRLSSAQGWRNRTLIGHERAIVHFFVLPGSLLSITEITEYIHFSLI